MGIGLDPHFGFPLIDFADDHTDADKCNKIKLGMGNQ